jgi:hypothetical protein
MEAMEVHIGSMIRLRAKELRIGPTELGAKINTSKQNVYGIYKRKSIDTRLLEKISLALDFDFFLHFSRAIQISSGPSQGSDAEVALKVDLGKAELESLRKENDYLKKINSLLEDKVARAGI